MKNADVDSGSECEISLHKLNMDSNDIESKFKNTEVNWSKAIQQVRLGQLSELKFAEERPYEKDDFLLNLDKRFNCLQFVVEIIKSLKKNDSTSTSILWTDRDVLRSFTVPCLILCGENVESREWTESRHIETRYDCKSH